MFSAPPLTQPTSRLLPDHSHSPTRATHECTEFADNQHAPRTSHVTGKDTAHHAAPAARALRVACSGAVQSMFADAHIDVDSAVRAKSAVAVFWILRAQRRPARDYLHLSPRCAQRMR